MIPIRDTIPTRHVPVVNNVLIGINVVVFLFELLLGSGTEIQRLIYYFGLVPARFTLPGWGAGGSGLLNGFTLISFMFLHGGFLHLLGNMWFLYIFGDNVEDRLGPLRYLLFYMLCGFASGLTHLALNAHSTAPTIGASGAVAGVMGAYFLLHPSSKILTLIPIIIIPWFIEIPAFVFLGLWFLLQLLNAGTSYGSASGIAWWAHIGGFVCGMLFLKLLDRLPSAGVTAGLRKATTRKKSHRFQVLQPQAPGNDHNLQAGIFVTPYEALVGASKLVTVPYGLQRRVYRVIVPPGIAAGKVLRLKGQGRPDENGRKGDVLLKVIIV
jgi:membrane associated rhomboid family serine protease